MFDDFSPETAQLNNDLVRAAYAITGSTRAAGRLIGLSPGTVSRHVSGYEIVGQDENGQNIIRTRGFTDANLAAMDAALNQIEPALLERLTAAQSLLAAIDEPGAEGYALWLKANPDKLNERITRAIEFAEATNQDLQDLAVEGINTK